MNFLHILLRLTILGFFGGLWLLAGVYLYLSPNLPDVETLRDVQLQTPMRVYTREGDLIGQFGEQKRSPLTFDAIPQPFVKALLAAEDDNFFTHHGIDLMGLARAVSELLLTGKKGSGGSTLTMQVARNYFLSLEQTYMRKFNEILLAIEIERSLTKDEIFELYFNRVFLGHRAYGFEAASQVYYGKSISDLDLAQYAMLAGIPKAPSRNNPVSRPESGLDRRNWILKRMEMLGYIDPEQSSAASQQPVTAELHGAKIDFAAHYAAEMARQQMLQRYGMAAYNDGFEVYTTISRDLQKIARSSVISGLRTYDERHGYRGPEQKFPPPIDTADATEAWLATLADIAVIADMQPAIVTGIAADHITVLFADGRSDKLLWENGIESIRPYRTENSRGTLPLAIAEVFELGDLIRLVKNDEDHWQLAQVPAAQAALVSLNPADGAIMSIVGGMGFELSKFNRATQAKRQPGSNFKPFVYAAAMEEGFTAASIINDAPVVLKDSALEDTWRPENDGGTFHGPTRLRWALTKSRNLVSIRLLQQLGIPKLIETTTRYGFDTSGFSRDLSLALGTQAMSPLEVATGYAMLANGGYRVEPYLISKIDDLNGNNLYTATPLTVCKACEQAQTDEHQRANSHTANSANPIDANDGVAAELSMAQILATQSAPEEPQLPIASRVMDERVNFILNSILQDVITRGTARRALTLKRGDLAGKTGTTNGPMDAWFSGYNSDVATTTWVGFDNYTPLGRREFGGTAALPIWIDFMRVALKNSQDRARPTPPGIVNVKIDPDSGLLATSRQENAIFEYFRAELVPQQQAREAAQGASHGTDDLLKSIF